MNDDLKGVALGLLLFILAFILFSLTACTSATNLDNTVVEVHVERIVCCGIDGRSHIFGDDPVQHWIDAGADGCRLTREEQIVANGLWAFRQYWTCWGPRWIFSRRSGA